MLDSKNLRSALLLSANCAAFICSGQAAAQTKGPEEGAAAVQEIIVTASKREQSSSDVGMSITAIGGESLATRGITEAADLTHIVPGFNYTATAYSTPVFTLRGIGFQNSDLGASPTVSVYVDEVPLPFSSETTGVGLDVQRVEVLKGPQGTLFGQNSTGGAVNYIANKPTDDFEAGIDLSFGRFTTVRGEGFLSGPLSNALSARLAFAATSSDDWQKSYTRPNDTIGSTEKYQARLLLDFHPSDRFNAVLRLSGWKDKSDAQAPQLIAITPQIGTPLSPDLLAYPLAPSKARAADWDSVSPFGFKRDNQFGEISLRAEYNLTSDIVLTSITAIQDFDRDQPVEGDATSFQDLYVYLRGGIKSQMQELRLSGTFSGKGAWMVGGNYEHDNVTDLFDFYFADSSANPTFGLPFDSVTNVSRQKVDTYAVFANVEYPLTDTLTLQGAVRYTDSNRKFAGCTMDNGNGQYATIINFLAVNAIQPGQCGTLDQTFFAGEITNELNQHNVSWRAGLNWQPDRDTLLYANVSKGFKSGSFPTLSSTTYIQFEPVTQEEVLAYEVGFKKDLFNRSLHLEAAAFYYDYKNKQIRGRITDQVFGVLEALVNIPKSHVKGFEMQAVWSPLEGLRLQAGGTYIDTEIDGDFSNFTPLGVFENFTGEPFPYTPKWQAQFDGEYNWSLSSKIDAFVGASASYQGSTNGGFGELPLLNIDAYTLVDLRVGIADPEGAWRFSLWGKNITDKYYWVTAARFNDATLRYAGMPATYGASFSYRFK